jgi:hypothetical protein
LGVNLLLFGPIQMENWLWDMGMQFFAPTACLTAALVVAGSRARRSARYLCCIGLATIATFSNGNGMILWVLLLPQLMWGPPTSGPKEQQTAAPPRPFIAGPSPWIILWIVAAALNFFLYFHGYHPPPNNPGWAEAWGHPFKALTFFLAFLGCPLAFGTTLNVVTQGITIGIILLLMTLAVSGYAFYTWRRRRDARLMGRMLPWMLAAAYSIGCGAVIAPDRLGLGIEGGLSSRYTTLALVQVVSLVFMVTLVLDHLIGADDAPRPAAPVRTRYTYGLARFLGRIQIGPLTAARIASALGGALIVMHLFTSNAAIDFCRNDRMRRLEGKACLLFIKQFKEDSLKWTVYGGDPTELEEEAEQLEALGYLRPSLITSHNVKDILGSEDMGLGLNGDFGAIDSLQSNGKDQCLIAGWAVFPGQQRSADAVLLTWETAGGSPTIFAVTVMGTPRNDIVDKLGSSAYQYCGWGKVFSASRLPHGNLLIRAWAFDVTSGKAFALNGQASINNGP